MKWVFLLALAFFTPMMAVFLRNNARHLPKAGFAVGFLFFLENYFHLSGSPISWAYWSGYVKGTEISLVDGLSLAIIFATPKFATSRSVRVSFLLFVFAAIISVLVAQLRMPATFYIWQLLRVALLFVAVSRASYSDLRFPVSLFSGLIVGLAIQAVVVTSQHLSGVVQAGGWFGHQNLLGIVSHFIVYPAFAAFLGGYFQKRHALAVAAGIVVAFAGGSRGTIALMGVGLVLTTVLSSVHRMSGRKTGLAAAAMIGLVLVSPVLVSAIDRRSSAQFEGSNLERDQMKSAARMVIEDHPLGAGANCYVMVANVGGYVARAGMSWTSAGAIVHNTYYLMTAEMGWIGLITFLGFLASSLAVATRAFRKALPSIEGEYAAGITASLLMVIAHASVEWVPITYPINALFAMVLGVVVAQNSRAKSRKGTNVASRRIPAPEMLEAFSQP